MAIAPDDGDCGQRRVWPVTDVFIRETSQDACNGFCQYNIRNS